jgi:hypothetical protein
MNKAYFEGILIIGGDLINSLNSVVEIAENAVGATANFPNSSANKERGLVGKII